LTKSGTFVGQFNVDPGQGGAFGIGIASAGLKSTILSVDAHGFKFEYTLNSAKHIPFNWVGTGRARCRPT
jgi:hypothetical protein